VLVAARNLPAGTLLRAEDVRWQDWALDDIPEGYFVRGQARDDAIQGAVVRRNFVVGEPLMQGHIVTPGDRGFLAAVLSPGNRAVTVAVDAVSAASGLIWPGDRVDLILTQQFDDDDTKPTQKAVGETILRDLRVLAIDQHLAEALPNKSVFTEGRMPRTVTLESTAAEAEKIAVAVSLGRLALALRSVGQDKTAATDTPTKPTWAFDVSPALELRKPASPAAHSTTASASPGPLILRGGTK
jgi:pilus assembly protein CpaB